MLAAKQGRMAVICCVGVLFRLKKSAIFPGCQMLLLPY